MAEEKTKRPASQYYWGDWWKDKALHMCSQPARGLWHEMNCLMHEGQPYGHLTHNGQPMTVQQLANLCRITPAKCRSMWDELLANGVPSIDEHGALYSRRMVRDEAVREARAKGGGEGAAHGVKGAEHGAKGGRPAKAEGGSKTPLTPAPNPPPSSSPSSSPSASPMEPSAPSASKSPRATRKCPEDFAVTKDMVRWALGGVDEHNVEVKAKCQHLTLDDLKRETEKFRNHTFATARSDWPATWRNWAMEADDRAKRAVIRSAPQQSDRQRRAAAAVAGVGLVRVASDLLPMEK